jgi:hypothetical protein
MFQKICFPTHRRYLDSQYWLGYCLFRLGKLDIQKNKFTHFSQAKEKLSLASKTKTEYTEKAKHLLDDCLFILSHLPKKSSITHYTVKRYCTLNSDNKS